jgi:tetratricopeptide (TPR) repeat protein
MGKLNVHLLTIIILLFVTISSYAQDSKSEDYSKAIKQADKYFSQGDYINAKTSYQYASGLKPDEQYPKDKLTATIAKLREKMAKMEDYTIVLTEADKFFREGDYENAIKKYKEASQLIPSEGYPDEKLQEIEDMVNAERKKKALFDDAIYRADKYIKYRKFEEAITEYEKALVLFPEEQLPQDKIAELQLKISEVGEAKAAYDEIVANADRLYLLKYFESAKSEYEKAAEALPEEEYPQAKIKEIDKLLVKKIDYDQLVNEGDEFYMNKNLDDAKKKYQAALTIYPAESYPKDMIDKINASMKDQVGEDELYQKAIASADQFFKKADYVNALKEYENAGNIKSRETYPQQKIAEINKILTDQENADLNYAMAINKGDQLLEASRYSLAKVEFEKAKVLKPDEQYPIDKLSEIDLALQQEEAVMESYNLSIKRADQYFESGKYEFAVEQYQNALVILPGDEYASKMLSDIESIWQEQNNNRIKYTSLVAEADKFFADNDLPSAREKYSEAYDLDSDADYPAEKIAEIDVMLQKIKDDQNAYNKAIATADIFYNNEEYKSALTEYQKANAVKPAESYPKERIDEINTVLLANVEKEGEYANTISTADNLLGQLNYEEAKMEYLKASYMKPEEQYPKDKIKEIEIIIAEIEANRAKYNMAVAAADRMMQSEEYNKAQAKYEEALSILPEEVYPKDKIAEIGNIIVANEMANQDSYNALILQADNHFKAEDYKEARIKYEDALSYKPNESYPKEQIEAMERLSDELEQKKDNYSQLVAAGDRMFSGREFQEAKIKYQAASDMFPDEAYPKEKITEINLIFKADFQEKQKVYDKAIADADKFFAANDLGKSMDSYKIAKSVLPDETYPDQMIEKILGILEANSVRKIVTSAVILENGQQREFAFSPMAYSDRSSSMLFIQAQNLGDSEFKLFISYGKGDTKNGGYSVPVPAGGEMKEYLIPLGNQRNWSSKDNDWVSLTTQGGSVEVRKIEITKQE